MRALGRLGAMRARAESLMTSTCTIRRPGDPGSRDASGFRTPGGTTIYSGPCQVADAGIRQLTVGGTQTEQATRILKLPSGTTGPQDSDVATIDSGDCAGLLLRLLEVTPKDHATALRIPCVED